MLCSVRRLGHVILYAGIIVVLLPLAFISVPPLLLPSYINQAHTSAHNLIESTLHSSLKGLSLKRSTTVA